MKSKEVAVPAGFEPATYCLEGSSILTSTQTNFLFLNHFYKSIKSQIVCGCFYGIIITCVE
ncbi:hypothetical protein [Flagellimonas onchidii]|uniref:hypothetical protein n=1 Tax=Flagellimonas onchidii TaxID=2562684 RepID=UPI00197AA442|nr:hypothetical protein [Allomuricauda onchidii]